MGNVWDKPITADTDWGGDASTNNLPVSGRQVQAWIKGSIKNDTQISQLVTAWFNQNTTKSNTFWKGLPIDANVLKWENNLLTIIEKEDDNSTNIDEEYLKDFIKNYLTENKYITAEELPFVYDAVKKTWLFEGDFVVTGAISMFSNLTNFTPSTVMDAVQVDGTTIVKNAQGQLTVIGGGGSGGSGGGLTAAEVNLLIANALSPVNENIATKWTQDDTKIANWDAAYNWGDHSAAGYVINTRKISTGTGLTGGGDLSADRTISLDTVGTAGTYTKVTTDAYGRVKSGSSLAASDIPSLDWSKITSGKPTTISGYGITDAYTKEQINTELAKYILKDAAQEISAQHNFVNGFKIGGLGITKSQDDVIYVDANLVVRGAVTMFGSGATVAPSIWASIPFDDTMEWNGSEWGVADGGSGSVNEATVNNLIYEYLTKNSYAKISDISSALTGYATQTWVGDNTAKYLGTASVDSARHAIGYDNFSMGSTNLPLVGGFISADQGNYGFQLLGSIQGNRLFVRSLYDGAVGTWSEIASQSWVGDNYLSKSGGVISFNTNSNLTIKTTSGAWSGIKFETLTGGAGYIGVHLNNPVFVPSDLSEIKWILHSGNYTDYFTKANIKSTLGISDWALAATKPSYTAAEVGALSTSGGSVSSDDYQPLIVNSNFSSGVEDVRIAISHNWNVKGLFNWESNGVGLRMYNTACGSAIGIKDDGTPYYDSYELIHSGNIGSYNAGSATKLQTSRTIWGQPFDGTGNITGDITFDSEQKISWHNSPKYCYISSPPTADAARLEYNSYGGHTFLGGNVAIGSTTASAKLHVHGTGCVVNHFSVGSYLGQFNADRAELSIVSLGDSPTDLMFGYSGTHKWSISSRSATSTVAKSIGLFNYEADAWAWVVDVNNNLAIGGTTASTKLHVYGDILATGAITMFSQLSMKNVIDYDGLSLAQLAQIRPARFTWKDCRDNRTHVGGIADYIQPILPEVVYETANKELTVDYGSAAFYVGASLIKPVIDHEKRIAELERENKRKDEVIAILQNKLNQLSA